MRIALAALVAVGAILVGVLAGARDDPAAAARPVVLAAGPVADASDRATGDPPRVSFSPDGDGRGDVAEVLVRARPGDRVRLVVRMASRQRVLVRTEPTTVPASGEIALAWDGRGPDGEALRDYSYTLQACAAGACSATRVVAHLRLMSVALLADVALAPGSTAPLELQHDGSGPVTVDLVPSWRLGGPGLGAWTVPGSGRVDYPLPDVPHGGLWAVRARAGDVVRYAPIVVLDPGLDPANPPEGTALVVYPVATWRGYDGADCDRDGVLDSWYNHPERPVVPRYCAYEVGNQPTGMPTGGRRVADGARFVAEEGLVAQSATDNQLDEIPLDVLRRYALIVFAGHHEYYEQRSYDDLVRYRDGGGSLLFLQGNSFYGQIAVGPDRIERLAYRYRTDEVSDFALSATGFAVCCWPPEDEVWYELQPGIDERLPWLLEGTGLAPGDRFGRAIHEVDRVDAELSPPGTIVVASAVVPAAEDPRDVNYRGSRAWILDRPYPYRPARLVDTRVDIAYAEVGEGRVFSWGNVGFMESIYDERLMPEDQRTAMRRAALNVWRHLAG